jgi:RimJ/RimL family protein N-acetyltransferase
MNPLLLRTPRLVLTPVGGADLHDLRAIKADPRVFAIMLGGVRSWQQTAEELAGDVVAWGANGFGIWTIRAAATGQFVGITGLERRPDGRGVALRFALWPEAQGHGVAG